MRRRREKIGSNYKIQFFMVKNMMKLWKTQKFAGFIPHLRVIYERTQSEIFKNLGRVIYERSSVNDGK